VKKKYITIFIVLLYIQNINTIEDPSEQVIEQEQGVSGSTFTHYVFLHFYHLHRLSGAVRLFVKLSKSSYAPIFFSILTPKGQCTSCDYCFSNPRVIRVIKKMQKEKSIYPFITLWLELNRYKYVKNPSVIVEFTILLSSILHSIAEQRKFSFQYIEKKKIVKLHAIDMLENMPLEELLDVLDLLVEELPEFLEKYELDQGIPWRQWLKKYWLLAPLGAAAFGLRLYLTYKGTEIEGTKALPTGPPPGSVPITL